MHLAKPMPFGLERHLTFRTYRHTFAYNVSLATNGTFLIAFADGHQHQLFSNWQPETDDNGSLVWNYFLAERFHIPIIETVNTESTATLYIRILDYETRWVFNTPDLRIEYDQNNNTDTISLFTNSSNMTMRWNIALNQSLQGEDDGFHDDY